MRELTCPGLPASWINAWLAAVGATVLSPKLRLRWTRDGTPKAVLSAQGQDPAVVLHGSWPDRATLDRMPIRRIWPNAENLPRRVAVDAFASRVAAVRGDPLSWTLSSTITDLHVDKDGNVAHAPFDPPMPAGRTMHDRLVHFHFIPGLEDIRRTLQGTGKRIKGNGLGFDIARIASEADDASKWIDPVVETLAFFGLALLPARGDGTDARLEKYVRASTIQRGWVRGDDRRAGPRFVWPAWDSPLEYAAIDALLDVWRTDSRPTWPRLGIHAAWRSVKYEARGTSDATRGFGAERLG